MKLDCPNGGKCGGCPWFDLEYKAQLERKQKAVNEALTNSMPPTAGGAPITVEPCPELLYYRNRMDYAFGLPDALGLKAVGSWDQVVNLDQCYLLSEDSVEVLRRVRDWARATGLPFWDQKKKRGVFRYCIIREGKNTDERMVMILTAGNDARKGVIERSNVLTDVTPHIDDLTTSIVHGINDDPTDVSRAGTIIPVKGDPWITETINGYQYRIHPNSFFQTNSVMAAKLQDTVREFCGDLSDKTLLDLYCGSGFFSIALAQDCKKAIGIELDPAGIDNARHNAELNKITNVEYHVSEAEKFDWTGAKPDVVILDPPRAGMNYKVLDTLRSALPERIVYVSCNYERLVKELPALSRHYKVTKARALDLFPHTPHVELVTLLEKL